MTTKIIYCLLIVLSVTLLFTIESETIVDTFLVNSILEIASPMTFPWTYFTLENAEGELYPVAQFVEEIKIEDDSDILNFLKIKYPDLSLIMKSNVPPVYVLAFEDDQQAVNDSVKIDTSYAKLRLIEHKKGKEFRHYFEDGMTSMFRQILDFYPNGKVMTEYDGSSFQTDVYYIDDFRIFYSSRNEEYYYLSGESLFDKFQKAVYLYKIMELESSYGLFCELMMEDPGNYLYYQYIIQIDILTENIGLAMGFCEICLEKTADFQALLDLYSLANMLSENGNYKVCYKQIVSNQDKQYSTLNRRAKFFMNIGEYENALADITQIKEEEMQSIDYFHKALIYFRQEKYDEAGVEIEKAISLFKSDKKEDSGHLYVLKSMILYMQGNTYQAAALINKGWDCFTEDILVDNMYKKHTRFYHLNYLIYPFTQKANTDGFILNRTTLLEKELYIIDDILNARFNH